MLTGHLNRVFHAVIAELDRYGGEVIYFSGDAITCWLDEDDGSRAAATGLAMQAAIEREGRVTTPGGLEFQLALKVAAAVGPARRFVVGDPDIQFMDVLAGGLVDLIAEAEHLAEKGEVVLHESALATLRDRVEISEMRGSAGTGSVGVVERLLEAVPDVRPEGSQAEEEELPAELSRPWLLPVVYERLSTGLGEFLAELRPAYPMFVSFGGIDFDADESANEKLHEFVRAAQRILSGYGGSLLQLTLGDKGANFYAVFGTPSAHEDDAVRACAAALDLLALERSTAAREIRIGITHGRLRSGTYGHARRRTFVCLGDAVNLAARLMSRAPAGEIYASELVRLEAGDSFSWTRLAPLELKGKAAPVAAFTLRGSTGQSKRAKRYAAPLVGRSEELATLTTGLEAAVGGGGRIIGISAEAGMGKSRLVAEFVRAARRRNLLVAFGECQAYGTSTAYSVWREIWRTLFALDEHAPADMQVEALERALGQVDPALVPRAPLLDALLGIPIPDTELTRSFDPKLRKTSLENLLVDCLRARANSRPVVLVLEDCHWLDALSRDLLDVLARAVPSEAVLLVVVYRPEAALPQGLGLTQLPQIEQLALAALGDAEMDAVVRARLPSLFGDEAKAATGLRDLVVGRAQGNPFYAEELLNFVHAREIDASDEAALAALELPGSLHSLVLSRIDTLSEAPRRTLKVASVVGRVFQAPMLPGVYPGLGALDDVRAHLGTLRLLDLVNPDREDDESYLFKHAVTHEVAYESLPFALRATLHRHVGEFIESHEADAIEQNLDLLAHHYWLSDNEDKKRVYLGRAAAAAQASYANAAAIDYYERLTPLLTEADRIDALLELGKVRELVGEWDRARETVASALELAEAVGDERARAWCEAALAEVARKQAHYDEAAERLSRAGAAFEALGDEPGLGRVLHLEGNLAFQRGAFPEARASYERSLEIGRRLGDRKMMGNVLSNLGMVAGYGGEYELAQAFNEQALELRTELGDRWAIAVSNTNLGMMASQAGQHDVARGRFEEAMRLNREVGDSAMIALSANNLGNAFRGLGDYEVACRRYLDSLRFHREHDDQWAFVYLLEDIARLAACRGEPERALELLGAADTLRDEIGVPRGDTLEDEIAADVEPAMTELRDPERDAARARGRTFDRTRGLDAAVALVEGVPGQPAS